MIRQFALEYASKCLLHTSTNGVTTRTSALPSDTPDVPLDLTVSRITEEKRCEKGRKTSNLWILVTGGDGGCWGVIFEVKSWFSE